MKISNTNVYNLAESIVASGFPMRTDDVTANWNYDVENIKYWLENDIVDIIKIIDRNKNIKEYHRLIPNDITIENDYATIKTRDNDGNITNIYKIDIEDIIKISTYKWGTSSDGYCKSSEFILHRFIMDCTDSNIFIDHINGDVFDNRKINLRKCTNQENCRNNKGVGVSFRKDRSKWRAYIMVDRKQINLGYYETIEEALKARQEGELKYFKEFSKYYKANILECENKYDFISAEKSIRRCMSLGNVARGTGHDNYLKGILVTCNITADKVFWSQWQRYSFQDIVSSMSFMHKLTSLDIDKTKFDKVIIDRFTEMVKFYNTNDWESVVDKSEYFEHIVNNTPSGIELTAHIYTNYLQLKTIYKQREYHKRESWRIKFIDWCNNLPNFKELTGV